jgi:hypothetical protein
MPKTPLAYPRFSGPCDPRLPQAALDFRLSHTPPLTTAKLLGAINVTAWLYQDQTGAKKVQVNPNTTIEELIRQFGPADTPDAEVGIHSEGKAGEWFRVRPQLRVLQIFTERIPCPKMCGPMLRAYFPGIPWYYYYDRKSWTAPNGSLLKHPAQILKTAYGI